MVLEIIAQGEPIGDAGVGRVDRPEIAQEMGGGHTGDGVPVHVSVFGLPGHAAVGRTGDAVDSAAGHEVDRKPIDPKQTADAGSQKP